MGNILLTQDSLRDLVSRRGIKVFDHYLIPNHVAVGSIVASPRYSGVAAISGAPIFEYGLSVLYTLDHMALSKSPAMSGVIVSGPGVSGLLGPGTTYINYISMMQYYQNAHSGQNEYGQTGASSMQGMIWDPNQSNAGSSGVINVVPEYVVQPFQYANVQVDYYPDDVAAISGLLPVSRLRIL